MKACCGASRISKLRLRCGLISLYQPINSSMVWNKHRLFWYKSENFSTFPLLCGCFILQRICCIPFSSRNSLNLESPPMLLMNCESWSLMHCFIYPCFINDVAETLYFVNASFTVAVSQSSMYLFGLPFFLPICGISPEIKYWLYTWFTLFVEIPANFLAWYVVQPWFFFLIVSFYRREIVSGLHRLCNKGNC